MSAMSIATVSAAHLGQTEEASKMAARIRNLYPYFRISTLGAYQEMLPQDLARWNDGLRKAGLPE